MFGRVSKRFSNAVSYTVVGLSCFVLQGCFGSGGSSTILAGLVNDAWQGYAVQLAGDVTTDANGKATQLQNFNVSGPSTLEAKVARDVNGIPIQIEADYDNGARTSTFNQNCQADSTNAWSCQNAAGERFRYTSKGTYRYLVVSTWGLDQVPANQTVSWSAVTGVVGLPTQQMPTSGTATYKGEVIMFAAASANATSMDTANGAATLTADFANGVVNGTFDNFKDSNGQALAGSIAMNAQINGNQLSGSVSGNVGPITGITGTAQGAFFGPNAEEVGGVMAFRANGYEGGGMFTAKK